MDIEQLRELIKLLKAEDLTEITLAEGDTRLTIRREGVAERSVAAATAAPAGAGTGSDSQADDGTFTLDAPLVGTFYRRAAPEDDTFVSIGDTVQAGDVVCIIEAMKVMNEIKAARPGRVIGVLAEDGDPVEYGQVLLRFEPL